jgi:hypothetical protein
MCNIDVHAYIPFYRRGTDEEGQGGHQDGVGCSKYLQGKGNKPTPAETEGI